MKNDISNDIRKDIIDFEMEDEEYTNKEEMFNKLDNFLNTYADDVEYVSKKLFKLKVKENESISSLSKRMSLKYNTVKKIINNVRKQAKKFIKEQ